MKDKLEFQYRLADISNENLEQTTFDKKKMIKEISSSDLLSATLKSQMYVERELNDLIEYFMPNVKTISNLKFASKLKLIYELGILEKYLFDVIYKLNRIRNEFAHKLNFDEDKDCYEILSDSLSGRIKDLHKIEIKMRKISHGNLSREEKYKILLAQIWIETVIFTSTKERRKMNFGEKIVKEVELDVKHKYL
ncbi:hypothetical protein [Rummeliibacillus sp. TYF-LIM-RU47]|uniref:hypothetical protein n=1 Tax=Rummeliibacillus sp. TYF-LIM-RU47 TaxID=2608406 RepID=UPI0012391CF7|nr:hypothetical protein [Rummeliibacillus sp. TYF-LIM-RU47]